MNHVLLTRFALRFEEDSSLRKYEQDPIWLDYRLQLFRNYCLPSVKAQTFQDFDWWILVDPSFPGLTVKMVAELERDAMVLFMDEPWNEKLSQVGELLGPQYNKKWVCSTRLDSDDMIHNEFMSMVAKEAVEREEWISFPNGYFLKERLGKAVEREYLRNPFISYVEYADPFTSVLKINHIRIGKRGPGIKTVTTPAWIQVDHGDNIKNDAGKKFPNFDVDSFEAERLSDSFTWRKS